jgi:hypothetical protein
MPPSIREPRFFNSNPVGVWTPHDKAYKKESGHKGVTNANMAESRTELRNSRTPKPTPCSCNGNEPTNATACRHPPLVAHVSTSLLVYDLNKFLVSCPSKKELKSHFRDNPKFN